MVLLFFFLIDTKMAFIQYMPRRPFSNLTIIDNTDLTDLDTNSFANAIMVAAPDTASLPCNAYELRDAIYQHHGITIALESISYYGPGFFLRLPTPAAKTHLLTNCFISINNNNFVFMPWKPQHGATSVPLQDLLRSNPLNLHLAKDTPTNEPYERLIIYISGMPPHLCSNSVLYRLFDRLCTINEINFISATLQYEITVRGQLSALPLQAHIGLRNAPATNDIIDIWPLKYEILRANARQGHSTRGTHLSYSR